MSFWELFNLSHWQDAIAMIFFIVVLVSIGFLIIKKKRIGWIAVISLGLTLIGILTFGLLKMFTASGWEEDARTWLRILIQIIVSMIIFFSPLLLFSVAGLILTQPKDKAIRKKGIYLLFSLLVGITGGLLYHFVVNPESFTALNAFSFDNWKWLNITLSIFLGAGMFLGLFIFFAKKDNSLANKFGTILRGVNSLVNVSFYFVDKIIWILLPLFFSYQIIGLEQEMIDSLIFLSFLGLMLIVFLTPILIKTIIQFKKEQIPAKEVQAWWNEANLVYDIEKVEDDGLKFNFFLMIIPSFLFVIIIAQNPSFLVISWVVILFVISIINSLFNQQENSFISNQILFITLLFIGSNLNWELMVLVLIFTKLTNIPTYFANLCLENSKDRKQG